MGRRSEKFLAAVKKAFPAERLLLLPAAELGGGGGAEKAAAVQERLVGWYLEREDVKRVGGREGGSMHVGLPGGP